MADRASVTPITDDMVEAALQAVIALGCGDRDDRCDPGCSCRDIDDKDRADFQLFVRTALSAALAGCTPVVLPEPDGVDENGDTWWEYPGGKAWSRANGRFDERTAARFRGMAAAMLAAVEHNELKHSGGSQVGDQHGE